MDCFTTFALFNKFTNELNSICDDNILEIKVYERGQTDLEVQFILKDETAQDLIREATRKLLVEKMGDDMNYEIKFVEFIDHDYRRKYRVIERIDDVEYAGGIVGDQNKLAAIGVEAPAGDAAPAPAPARLPHGSRTDRLLQWFPQGKFRLRRLQTRQLFIFFPS